MRIPYSYLQILVGIAAMCFLNNFAYAWQSLTSDIDIRCIQKKDMALNCQYRPLFPGVVSNIRATSGNLELPVQDIESTSENITAIFFLIDTSDPGRQNVISKNIQQIDRLLASASPSHRIGLASFDKKLRILAPIGSSKDQIITSTQNILAEGKTTELYRNLLLTIEKLSRFNASRKAIFLFSDGQAEDKAYFHSDVVNAARKKGVVINGIGFPRSVSLSVALQTLRRISEETGGIFTEANSNFDLDDNFYQQPYDNIDAAQDINIDLSALANNRTSSASQITLNFATDIGNIEILVPVSSPITKMTNRPNTATSSPAVLPVQAPIRIVTPASKPKNINYWLWYGLPVALVIIFLISLITLILTYKKQPDKAVLTNNAAQQNKPFAYLVTQEEKSKRYPITSTTWRIGRSKDNELSLDDNSVSRLHAEIHRYNNGNFFIMDMQSLNGIHVNDEQVSNKKLQEGDIIEIGDIFLRFTQHSEDYQLSDDTAIQITKNPYIK